MPCGTSDRRHAESCHALDIARKNERELSLATFSNCTRQGRRVLRTDGFAACVRGGPLAGWVRSLGDMVPVRYDTDSR